MHNKQKMLPTMLCVFLAALMYMSFAKSSSVQAQDFLRLRYEEQTRFGKGPVRQAAWRPDGQQLAVASPDGIWIYTPTLAVIDHLTIGDDEIRTVSWSPDGSRLVSSSYRVHIWDMSSRTLEWILPYGADPQWSPDGSFVAASVQNFIVIWDVYTKQNETSLEHANPVMQFAWSPDSTRIAATEVGTESLVHVWDVATSTVQGTIQHTGPLPLLKWNPAGTLIAYAGGVNVFVWNGSAPQPMATLAHSDLVQTVEWSHNGVYLATSGRDGLIHIWDGSTFTQITTLAGHPSVSSVKWSQNDQKLASFGDYGTIKIWDVATWTDAETYEIFSFPISPVDWHPDNQRLAFTDLESKLVVLNITQPSAAIQRSDHTRAITKIAWRNDGGLVAITDGQHIQVRDPLTGAVIHQRIDTSTRALDWSSDGSQIVGVGRENRELISSSSGVVTNHIDDVNTNWTGVVWNPVDNRVAVGSDTGDVGIWDTQTSQTVNILGSQEGSILNLAWSPSGTRLASAAQHSTVIVWDVATGTEIFTFDRESPADIAWSPDGSMIAINGDQGNIYIIDANSGAILQTIDTTIINPVIGYKPIAWSADSQKLTIIDGVDVFEWDINTQTITGQGLLPTSSSVIDIYNGGEKIAMASDAGVRIFVREPLPASEPPSE
jgi:WD40 repeat protein